jgi:hypothetical protein
MKYPCEGLKPLQGLLLKTQTPLRTGPVPTGFVLGRMCLYYRPVWLENPEFNLRGS